MAFPGGKGRCFQKIVSLMPRHQTYIETHLGSGAVMLAKRPAETSLGIDIDPRVVSEWGSRHPGVRVIQADAADFLGRYGFTGHELVYCDPPYLRSTKRRPRVYRFEYTVAQHVELLEVLGSLRCPVMVSGYRSELYDRSLSSWHRSDFVAPTQAGLRVESVWTNYDPPTALHDFRFIGGTFREREAIRRRRDGILRRIDLLPAIERNAVIAAIADRYGTETAETAASP